MLDLGRALGRAVLRAWGRLGKAPGWHYRVVDRYGPLLANEGLTTTLVNGCVMGCDVRDHVQRQIYFLGLYEPVEAYVFTRLAFPGATVIDAGANVGQYTLLASTAVGDDGMVHSFEPIAATFERLRDHVERNGLKNVHLNRAALWDGGTSVRLALEPEFAANCGAFSVGSTNASTVVECPAVAFDDYAAERKLASVDLVKMDIEGAESKALAGMRRTLEKCRPVLLLEVNRAALRRAGADVMDLWSLLAGELGYRACVIGHSSSTCHGLENLDGITQRNVLLYPERRPAVLEERWDLKTVLRWATTIDSAAQKRRS